MGPFISSICQAISECVSALSSSNILPMILQPTPTDHRHCFALHRGSAPHAPLHGDSHDGRGEAEAHPDGQEVRSASSISSPEEPSLMLSRSPSSRRRKAPRSGSSASVRGLTTGESSCFDLWVVLTTFRAVTRAPTPTKTPHRIYEHTWLAPLSSLLFHSSSLPLVSTRPQFKLAFEVPSERQTQLSLAGPRRQFLWVRNAFDSSTDPTTTQELPFQLPT